MALTPAERRAHATLQISEMARMVLAQVDAGPEARQPTDDATACRFEAIARSMAGALGAAMVMRHNPALPMRSN